MLLILDYWRYILTASATALLCWLIATVHIDSLNRAHEAELKAQADIIRANCQTVANTSEEIGHDLQSKNTAITADLERTKRLRVPACITVHPVAPASERDATTGAGQPGVGQVATGDFLDRLAHCDEITNQLTAAQEQLKADRR